MSRKLASLVAVAAIAPAGIAVAALKANGYSWSGKASGAGGQVSFATNLVKTRVKAGLSMAGPPVSCTNGVQSGPVPLVLRKTTAFPVRRGHFSTALGGKQFPYGKPGGTATGTFAGRKVTGRVNWRMTPRPPFTCTPDHGSFTWSATRGAKTYPGGG